MKSSFLTLLLMVLTLAGCKKQLSFDERCEKEARMLNLKYCPRQVSDCVMSDSIAYLPSEKALCYYYTFSDELDDTEAIRQGEPEFRNALKAEIISSIELKKYKDHGVTFKYIYFSSSSHEVLLEEIFTKKDYSPLPR
ncbi:MAG: hypothetical protein IJ244_06000 [Bacteroidaceae bacterium]|nr:hypothetical protein [Bacteroidaceae bacterium]